MELSYKTLLESRFLFLLVFSDNKKDHSLKFRLSGTVHEAQPGDRGIDNKALVIVFLVYILYLEKSGFKISISLI